MSTYAASIEDDRPGWIEQVMCFAVVLVRLWGHLRHRALARRELESLDRYILSDIGLTRGAALALANGHLPARAVPVGDQVPFCSAA